MKIQLLAVCFLIASQAMASGFTGAGSIKSVHQRECTGDKGFEVEFYESHNNPDNCADTKIVDIPCDHAAYKTIVSLTMVAFTSNKQINYWVKDCESGQAKATTARILQ